MKNITLLCLALLINIGCTNGYLINTDTPKHVKEITHERVLGVRLIASMSGTYARINKDWVLTAKHNKLIFNEPFYSHPTCDVALVRLSGEGGIRQGLVYQGDVVLHTGYALVAGFMSSQGIYKQDSIGEDCQYSVSTGVIYQGMSGGPVTNKQGELVGILARFSGHTTYWVSVNYISEWMNSVMDGEL